MVPYTEGKKEVKEVVTEGAEEEAGEWSDEGDVEGGEEQDADEDDGSDGGKDDKESKEKGKGRAAGKVRKKPHRKAKYMRVKKKDKKQTGPLNLNNEVVNMRKEVKRVRVLIFRKMLRQVAALKKKKGSGAQVEKHHRRAERLMVEIQAMKVLAPDVVTKTALQKVLDFERVCKNPKSTMTDRAIARIATHPQFKQKIDAIKAAVKAFKEERLKEGKKEEEEEEVESTEETAAPGSPVSESESPQLSGEEGAHVAESEASTEDEEEAESLPKDTTVSKPEQNVEQTPQLAALEEKKVCGTKTVKPVKAEKSQVKDIVKEKPQSESIKVKPPVDPTPQTTEKRMEEESDIESSGDEEKEYFDDSTEERFRKQSSQSEETDSDNDFFLGKVSKFKKKKKKRSVEEGEEKAKTTDQVQSQLDELESRLKSKAGPLQSIFCTSLAGSQPSRGRGAGRGGGRGENKFRGRGKQWGSSRDFGRPSKFQAQDKGEAGSSAGKHTEPYSETSPDIAAASAGRGRGRGRGRGQWRGDFAMQNRPRGGGALPQQPPQQVLHPSWEASKKRKEQQGQILAFQGKKIKFDDD